MPVGHGGERAPSLSKTTRRAHCDLALPGKPRERSPVGRVK